MNAERLIEHKTVCEISRQLHRLTKEGHIRLLVNLGGVMELSGEAIATLAGLYREVHTQDGRLGVLGLKRPFRDMLQICHLDKMVEIYADESDAVRDSGKK
jgi:anti-anti-sigma factor